MSRQVKRNRYWQPKPRGSRDDDDDDDEKPSTSANQQSTSAGPSSQQRIRAQQEGPKDLIVHHDRDQDQDQETERQIMYALRRAQKDNTTIDGKVNIVSQIEGPREALCVKYTEEFDYIAAGFSDGVIRVYSTSTGEQVFTLADPDVQDNRSSVTSIKHRPVSKVYPITNCITGTYANGCVKCWSYHFNQCLYTIREKRQTFGITYHPRFPKFVTFGDDLKVYFYDEDSKMQERVLMASEDPDRHDGHMNRVFAACFHPRNNYELITGGWDNVVQFWDLRQPYATRHLSGLKISGEGLDINSKGTEILACAYQRDDALQLFDYGSGRRIAVLEPDIYTPRNYCGKYVAKDFVITGGTDPNIVRIVDMGTTATTASINFLPGGVYGIDIGQAKKKTEKDKEQTRMKNDLSVLPRVAFVSTKKIYQIEFY